MSPAGFLSILNIFIMESLLAGRHFQPCVDDCSAVTARCRTALEPGEGPRVSTAGGYGNSRISQRGYGDADLSCGILRTAQAAVLARRAGRYLATMRPGETIERGGGGSQGGQYSPELL